MADRPVFFIVNARAHARGGVILNQATADCDRRPEPEYPEQQRPERGRVFVLDGVKPIPIEKLRRMRGRPG